jgi:hypothetical protein
MSFMAFDSFDEMSKWMDDRTSEANIGLAPEQQQITYGDCWARFDHLDTVGMLFGQVMTKAEWLASELAEGAPEGEANYSLARVEASHQRGYMHGLVYSPVEPDGEYGDTHRANIWPIEERLFLAASIVEWRHEDMSLADRINLSIAFEQWRQHEMELIAAARAKLAEEKDAL